MKLSGAWSCVEYLTNNLSYIIYCIDIRLVDKTLRVGFRKSSKLMKPTWWSSYWTLLFHGERPFWEKYYGHLCFPFAFTECKIAFGGFTILFCAILRERTHKLWDIKIYVPSTCFRRHKYTDPSIFRPVHSTNWRKQVVVFLRVQKCLLVYQHRGDIWRIYLSFNQEGFYTRIKEIFKIYMQHKRGKASLIKSVHHNMERSVYFQGKFLSESGRVGSYGSINCSFWRLCTSTCRPIVL